jgi:galactokinase
LRTARLADLTAIDDPVIRARAEHVVSENERVRHFAALLREGDLGAAGALMVASHHSLRDLYETSTPVMDAAVDRLLERPGVHGARMTGGGFGGCVVALTEPGAIDDGWVVRAVDGASVVSATE